MYQINIEQDGFWKSKIQKWCVLMFVEAIAEKREKMLFNTENECLRTGAWMTALSSQLYDMFFYEEFNENKLHKLDNQNSSNQLNPWELDPKNHTLNVFEYRYSNAAEDLKRGIVRKDQFKELSSLIFLAFQWSLRYLSIWAQILPIGQGISTILYVVFLHFWAAMIWGLKL